MPAYNFKKEFADLVEQGIKRQTIRPKRKRPTVPGDKLMLYTGMRTKNCRKLRASVCREVSPIIIAFGIVVINGVALTGNEFDSLASDDGFKSVTDFFNFFKKQYKFPTKNLKLIKW